MAATAISNSHGSSYGSGSKKSSSSMKLSANWQLNAALLSSPADLTALVSLSKTHPT